VLSAGLVRIGLVFRIVALAGFFTADFLVSDKTGHILKFSKSANIYNNLSSQK
jgi:hypothetical protein